MLFNVQALIFQNKYFKYQDLLYMFLDLSIMT